VAHHLQVIAPKDLVEPAFVGAIACRIAVALFALGGVELRAGKRALALPMQHGVTANGLELVFFDRGHFFG